MPFTANWLIPQKIADFKLYGALSIDELRSAFQCSAEFLARSSNQQVHYVHDWTQLESYPTSAMQIYNFLSPYFTKDWHRIGWVVAYVETNPHTSLRYVGSTVFTTLQLQYKMVEQRSEALQFLQTIDAEIEVPKLLAQ